MSPPKINARNIRTVKPPKGKTSLIVSPKGYGRPVFMALDDLAVVNTLKRSGLGGSALSNIADGDVLANITGATAKPIGNPLSAVLDHVFGNSQGDILYRNASGWVVLAPGTSGTFLKTQGPAANPIWAATTGGSGGAYWMPRFDGTIDTSSFATVGNFFVPINSLSIAALDAVIQPSAGGFTYKFSIVACTTPSGGNTTVSSQVYVSPSNIAASGTSVQRIAQTLASAAVLSAGTLYGFLLTRTDSTTTSPADAGGSSAGDNAHSGYLTFQKGIIGGGFTDMTLFGKMAANVPPTSGSIALGNAGLFIIGIQLS